MNSDRPLVLGHRGASAHAGDNTIEAFELALAHGADGVELDVRFTADGEVVLLHDPDVGEMGPLIHHEFATVRHAHPEIPTLDEALAALGDLIVNVEIKNSPFEIDFDPEQEMAEAIARWVSRHDIHERVVVTSFNPDTVATVQAADPLIVTGLLTSPGFDWRNGLPAIADAGHTWFAPHFSDVLLDPEEAVAAAHDLDLRIVTWTVDDPDDIAALAAAGIDAIICNDPGHAKRVLAGS
jgi:glycerophosphoryl diester phosphodiesterase